MRRTIAFVLPGLVTLGLVTLGLGCSDTKTEESFDRQQIFIDTADNVITPGITGLAETSAALDTAARDFCADRTQPHLDAARQAWKDAKVWLKRAEAWSFGPYRAYDVAIYKDVDKAPVFESNIEDVVAGTESIEAATIADQDYTLRAKGLPAVGYLLFFEGDQGTLARFEAGTTAGDRRCDYLTATTAHTEQVTAAYLDKWAGEGGYAQEFKSAGDGSDAFVSEQAALQTMIGTMIFAADDSIMMKLEEPLGTTTGGEAQPGLVEGRFSGTAKADIIASLEGIEMMFAGDGGTSLRDYTKFRQNAPLDQTIMSRIQAAKDAVNAIEGPLDEAVVSSPDEVQAAVDAIEQVKVSLEGDLSTLLGINPTNVRGDND